MAICLVPPNFSFHSGAVSCCKVFEALPLFWLKQFVLWHGWFLICTRFWYVLLSSEKTGIVTLFNCFHRLDSSLCPLLSLVLHRLSNRHSGYLQQKPLSLVHIRANKWHLALVKRVFVLTFSCLYHAPLCLPAEVSGRSVALLNISVTKNFVVWRPTATPLNLNQ